MESAIHTVGWDQSTLSYLNGTIARDGRSSRRAGCLLNALGFFIFFLVPFGVRYDVWAELAKNPIRSKGHLWLSSGLSAAKTATILAFGWGLLGWISSGGDGDVTMVSFVFGMLVFGAMGVIGWLWVVAAAYSVVRNAPV